MIDTSKILILIALNKDYLTKVKEYGEGWNKDFYYKYPFDSSKGIEVGKNWTLECTTRCFTFKGRIYIKVKSFTNDGAIVSWYKTKQRIYTAHNVRNKCEVIFG